ncbi:Long-chain-fatty-acid--CoA ligase FadD17 [Halioglobus japonicus]|nr:Long-chain-fatty-acid--CoA ligase FadD17 [Halioglobus japonicus]
MTTVRELIQSRADDDSTALLFEDDSWTYREFVEECSVRANFLLENRLEGPFHVGVLLQNVPEYPMWLGAAALAGAVIVGINPTRRGADLARDINHTDCQLIITEQCYQSQLENLDLNVSTSRILNIDDEGYGPVLQPYRAAPIPAVTVTEKDTFLLIFTSGTSGAPKACICSQGRLAVTAENIVGRCQLNASDVLYQVMPMFHSNTLMAAWAPALVAGATSALRRKFSASGFLPDVRKFGATYFNYVGKPLAFILATEEKPDDASNSLTRIFGNEAAEQDRLEFSRRFGCEVTDGYGSTEGGVRLALDDETPANAIGRATEGVVVLNATTEEPCAIAQFDEQGRLMNADEAVGELVDTRGARMFEGYWNNEEATNNRVRKGYFWSGDLAYRDANDVIYFAGRDSEWLRVDGENIAVTPIERVISRHPDVVLACVYAVPDAVAGDNVMVALQLRESVAFDPARFIEFLGKQSDFGTKWMPRYIRVDKQLPVTQTNKIIKTVLSKQRWTADVPVWGQLERNGAYVVIGEQEARLIDEAFEKRGRGQVLAL